MHTFTTDLPPRRPCPTDRACGVAGGAARGRPHELHAAAGGRRRALYPDAIGFHWRTPFEGMDLAAKTFNMRPESGEARAVSYDPLVAADGVWSMAHATLRRSAPRRAAPHCCCGRRRSSGWHGLNYHACWTYIPPCVATGACRRREAVSQVLTSTIEPGEASYKVCWPVSLPPGLDALLFLANAVGDNPGADLRKPHSSCRRSASGSRPRAAECALRQSNHTSR